ncbi:MAG TPA: acyl carrier protein [Candidatus Binataceae bacterium]|jgi:acyl carrier protein|nr:acyl carrier protein [Candidatus Binataceae bacterium]
MKRGPLESAIRSFLVGQIFNGSDVAELGADDLLLGRKAYDSIAIARTVAFCEATFDVAIPDDQVLPEHFESVRAIARLVERLRRR